MTIYYEFEALPAGWLVGWHEGDTRPNSTLTEPVGIDPHLARWNGTAWVSDSAQHDARTAAAAAAAAARAAAILAIQNFDPGMANPVEVRDVLGAVVTVLQLRNL
jgi:hypothetical protein